MVRRVLVLVVVLAGCKSMGGIASGVGKVAGGFGHVASHAAGAIGHVAAPVASGVAHAAPVVAKGVAKAAPAVLDAASLAVQIGEPVAEALATEAIEDDPPPVVFEPPAEHHDPQDLCLDCPDAGNCASCPLTR